MKWCQDAYEAAADADLLVTLTEWNAFRALDLAQLASGMATPRMADLRNIYNASDARIAGFKRYDGVGRAGFDVATEAGPSAVVASSR